MLLGLSLVFCKWFSKWKLFLLILNAVFKKSIGDFHVFKTFAMSSTNTAFVKSLYTKIINNHTLYKQIFTNGHLMTERFSFICSNLYFYDFAAANNPLVESLKICVKNCPNATALTETQLWHLMDLFKWKFLSCNNFVP